MISLGIELYCFLTFLITHCLEPYWVMQESEFFLDWQIIAVTSDTVLPIEWHSTAGSIRRRLGVSTVHGQLDMWDDSVFLQSATSLAHISELLFEPSVLWWKAGLTMVSSVEDDNTDDRQLVTWQGHFLMLVVCLVSLNCVSCLEKTFLFGTSAWICGCRVETLWTVGP